MIKPKTWRDKSVGEMNGHELKAACYAATGLREPSDPAQIPAFMVAQALVLGMRGFSDRDLIEKFVIDLVLGDGDAVRAAVYRPLVETAIGRSLEPDEIRRYPLSQLQAESDRRQQQKDALFE